MKANTRLAKSLVISAVLLMSVLVSAALLPERASAYTPIEIESSLPTFAAKSQKISFTLTIKGGPASDMGGNFSYKAEIIAKNKTGSTITPTTASSSDGLFNLNLTLPGEGDQTIKVRFNATSKDPNTSESQYKVREFEIKVVDPIVIRVTVYNAGHVDANNVTVEFFADGILLGEQLFSVPALSERTLTQNWTWANIANGKHVVTVLVDDPNGVVEFSDGNNVYSLTVYVGEQSNPVGGVLTIGVIIMSVLVALTILAKPPKRKKS